MNKKHFFAPSAWRLGGAARRAATALLLCVLTMTVQTAWAETVTTNYVDANGTTHNGVTATVLTGSETTLEADTWYYLQTSIAYNHALTLGNGEVTLILGNGATMSFPQADIVALNGDYNPLSSLTIYGQTLDDSQAGKLVCTGVHTGIRVRNTYTQHSGTVELSGYRDKLLYAGTATKADGSITVNGGKLKVNYSDTDDYAIHATKFITFNGGKVEVTNNNGSRAAVQCSYLSGNNNVAGTITLGWTRATDYIRATSYYGNVTLAKDFIDENSTLHTPDNVGTIAGKTLQPAPAVAVTLGQGVTATSGVTTEGGQTYATIGATVTVSVAAPEGYTSSVTYTPEGGEATAATDLGGGSWSFTVPDAAVTVSTALSSTGQPVSVSYMRADGSTATAQAVALDGTETELGQWGQEKWYFVGAESVTYHATVRLDGSTNIILKDGCTMSIGEDADGKRINGYGINGNTNYALTIYGQSLDDATAGHLKVVTIGNISCYGISYSPYTQHSGNVTVKATSAKAILSYGDVTVNGGTLSVTSLADVAVFADDGGDIIINGGKVNSTSSTDIALWSWSGNVTINGGQVEAISNSYGIWAGEGTITLGWTNATDYIRASSYEGTVKVADGLAFLTDDATPQQVSGTVGNLSLINGKKLTPDLAAAFTANSDGSYTIGNAYGWGLFCDRLAAADGKAFFSGKTVKLANDISVTRMAGGSNHEFTGTFDGDGHTLTVSISSSDGNAAPFREIMGATIRNLKVSGTVSGHKHSAGLVSYARGADSSVENTIENCLVATDVSTIVDTDGDCYLGGIVGHGFNCKLTIRGCAFTGSLTSPHNYTGGLQGWSDGNILTLQNDLFAPTSVSAANAGFHPVAFHNNNSTTTATVSNVYYTVAPTCTQATRIATANAAEQPKQTRTIEAGANVSVAHAGVPTVYDVSRITAYKATAQGSTFIPGLLYNNNVLYAGSGDAVSLTLTNTPPTGYTFDSYTASPDGATLSADGDNYTLTMPDADVTITATFIELPAGSVSYIDGNGVERYKQPGEFTVLTGTETSLGSSGTTTWYVVNSDISHDGEIDCYGDVHIILCDGKTMTVDGGENYLIDGLNVTIYGQTLGTGTLDASSTGSAAIRNAAGNMVINGGTVTATGTTYGIMSNVTINGGTVNATGGSCCIAANYSAIINGGTVNATGGAGGIQVINSIGNITISGGTVNADGSEGGIVAPNTTISGGTVNATGGKYGISGNNVTISGGQVEAIGGSADMFCGGIIGGTITLGWTNANDYIHASRYSFDNITVTIASGKTLYDEDNTPYSGTIEKVNGAYPIDGKTLRPLDYVLVLKDDADNSDAIAAAAVPGASPSGTNVILQGRKLWKDGAWNTLVLPFSIANIEADGCPLKGATVRELNDASITGTTLTLNFKPATTAIAAGVPYIVKWADGEAGQYTQDPVFQGVTIDAEPHNYDNQAGGDTNVRFIGTYDQKTVNTEDQSILFLGAANTLYYPSGHSATTIGAFRAYFKIGSGDALARQLTVFNFGFGDETNAVFDLNNKEEIINNNWYSLDGVKLDGKPTKRSAEGRLLPQGRKKGLYIHNGKKVVIK